VTTSDVAMLRESVERLFAVQCTPEAVSNSEGAWMTELWNALSDMGVPWVGIPEKAGGVGGDLGHAIAAVELAARHSVPLPIAETSLLGGRSASGCGLVVPEGEPLTVGWYGPGFEGQINGGNVVISGKATRVPWGTDAGTMLVQCATEDGDIVAFVPLNHEGIAVQRGSNLAGEPRDDVTVTEVTVGTENWAPTELEINQLRARGAAARSLAIAAAADRVLELTVEYAKSRAQFGRPIADFQIVRHHVARLAGAAAAARAAAYLARKALESGDYFQAASAKVVASEAAGNVCRLSHQIHGAMGLTRDYPMHLLTRRLWSWRDEFGSEQYWSKVLGRHLVTVDNPWDVLVPGA
jgi:acyl-CoA dehydrogenase